MSFLAPFFLIGAVTLVLPVVFHLIRRATRKQTLFSSLMFLAPTPPRLTRRSRLEHIVLMALRCLALCLLTFGFARPFIKQPVSSIPSATPLKRIILLVDTSASMRRAGLWTEARKKAEAVLRATQPFDQVALFTFSRQVTPLVTFDQWNSAAIGDRAVMALGRLAETSPDWSATHLGSALITAAEALADSDSDHSLGTRQIIVLISDLQEGSRLGPLPSYQWPKGIQLVAEPVKAKSAGNAGLQFVGQADQTNRNLYPDLRVRVSNATDSTREQFKVGWARLNEAGLIWAPIDVYVPPGQSRVVVVPAPPVDLNPARILLQGDQEDFDNAVFIVPPEIARPKVLYLGTESERDTRQPLYFLQHAFQETPRHAVQVLARTPGMSPPTSDIEAAALFVVTDALPDASARALHDQIIAGKTLLLAPKSAAAISPMVPLLGLNGLKIEEAWPNSYAMLAEIDFRHPLFAPFANPQFSDFTKIHFWKFRRLDADAIAGARVVAKFDTGDAALLEIPKGKGRILVMASGWHPADSQLALSTKFVPLLYSLLEHSGGAMAPPLQYQVGDILTLTGLTLQTNAPATIRAPDGSPLTLAAGTSNILHARWPGIYTAASVQPPKRFAVNLDASESRTAQLSLDELEQAGAPISSQTPESVRALERQIMLHNTELESRQKLWRWFIVGALAVLLVESWLAGWTARRGAVQNESTI